MVPLAKDQNELGEYFVLTIEKEIYDNQAIMKTCYALTEKYYIHVAKSTKENALSVYFYSKDESSGASIDNAVREFLALLLENQMRQIVFLQTGTIREEIIKRAFSPVVAMAVSSNIKDEILTSSV